MRNAILLTVAVVCTLSLFGCYSEEDMQAQKVQTASAQQQAKEAVEQLVRLNGENKTLQVSLKKAQEDLKSAQEAKTKAEEELKRTRTETDRIKKMSDIAKADALDELTAAKKAAQQAKNDLDNALKKVTALDKKNAELETQVQNLKRKLAEAQSGQATDSSEKSEETPAPEKNDGTKE